MGQAVVNNLTEEDFNWDGSLADCEFSLKFKDIYIVEFRLIITSGGKCPIVLYRAMTDIANLWLADTQEPGWGEVGMGFCDLALRLAGSGLVSPRTVGRG